MFGCFFVCFSSRLKSMGLNVAIIWGFDVQAGKFEKKSFRDITL